MCADPSQTQNRAADNHSPGGMLLPSTHVIALCKISLLQSSVSLLNRFAVLQLLAAVDT